MTTAQMPLWLVDKLDGDGVLDKATRLTPTPKPRRCPDCGTRTLAALNDLGLPTYVDPAPITNLGEVIASVADRPTYGLDHGQLYRRDHWHIRGRPAETTTVHAEHVCGQSLPAKPQAPASSPHPTDPPF